MQAIFWNGNVESNRLGDIMAEIFKNNVYYQYFVGKKDMTVIDLGANIGLTSLYFAQFAKEVFSFEPAKEHYECLTKMIEYNKLTNIHPFKYAISGQNKKVTFNHYANRTAFSMTYIDPINLKATEEVEAVTIDKVFEMGKIKHCHFMKMDIEGEEFNVLGSPEFTKVAPLIDTISIELHQWAGRNFNQAKESLRQNGFEVRTAPADASIIIGYKI